MCQCLLRFCDDGNLSILKYCSGRLMSKLTVSLSFNLTLKAVLFVRYTSYNVILSFLVKYLNLNWWLRRNRTHWDHNTARRAAHIFTKSAWISVRKQYKHTHNNFPQNHMIFSWSVWPFVTRDLQYKIIINSFPSAHFNSNSNIWYSSYHYFSIYLHFSSSQLISKDGKNTIVI